MRFIEVHSGGSFALHPRNAGGPYMITDVLSNAARYATIAPGLESAIEFTRRADLASYAIGRHSLRPDTLFAIFDEYATQPEHERRWEAHRRFWDLQIVLAGRERLGYALRAEMRVISPYDEERDVAFFEGAGDFVTLVPGRFALLGPDDVHKPGCAVDDSEHVRKLVIKVGYNAPPFRAADFFRSGGG